MTQSTRGATGDQLHEVAQAKINLSLRVLGRRPDGYHELASLVAFAELGDRLIVRPGQGTAARLTVTGPFAEAIVGDNLVMKALDLIGREAGRTFVLDLALEKNLPVAAGIGGGSADAAALLRAIRRTTPDLPRTIDWMSIARRIGADVPVCLASTPAFMTGIGDRLHQLALPGLDVVLANAGAAAPADKTRQVFTALSAPPLASQPPMPMPYLPDLDAVVALVRRDGNDLEQAAIRVAPTIARVKALVSASKGCLAAVLSGAGPTVIGLYGSPAAAAAAANAIGQSNPRWWVVATTLTGSDAGSGPS